jgi:hypothetical protein
VRKWNRTKETEINKKRKKKNEEEEEERERILHNIHFEGLVHIEVKKHASLG